MSVLSPIGRPTPARRTEPKMIPKLIGALRRAWSAVGVSAERGRAFFEALYQLHIAAITSTVAAAAEGKPRELPPLPAAKAPALAPA